MRADKTIPQSSIFYGSLAIIAFGFTLPVTRLAIQELDIIFVGLGRAIVAAIFATIVILIYSPRLPPKSIWIRLIITSLGVVIGFPLFATIAMKYANASHGGVILAILPLATAIASVPFANERPSLGFWICGILGSGIVIIFALSENNSSENQTIGFGDLFLFLAVISAAIGYAQGGALSKTLGGWQVICWALIIGAPLLIPVILIFSENVNYSASMQAWGSFVYLALISQFLGFFAWNKALASGGIAKIGQLQLLQPFVTLLASAYLIGELISYKQILFAMIVVCIVAIGRNMNVVVNKDK